MPTIKRQASTCSTSSVSSTESCKSVQFNEHDDIWYTFSASDYDRSAVQEDPNLLVSLGNLHLSDLSDDEVAIFHEKDQHILTRNTFTNGRRNTQGYAVALQVRYSTR